MSTAKRSGVWWDALEAAGTLLVVLALFSSFLFLLNLLFPSATPLKELIVSSLEPGPVTLERTVEATLAELQEEVKIRRGDSVAWGEAHDGMQLFSQDAVQTFDHSGATVTFGPRDRLLLGSNSLVVVTRLNAREETGPRSYRVQVEGELKGSFSAARKLEFEIAAAGHLARVKPGAATRFTITRNDDNSASVAVYSGELRLADLNEVRIPANFGVTLRDGVPAGKVFPLPPAPQLLGPQPAEYRYRTLPPKVRLAWSGAPALFHFQLSHSADFRQPLVDRRFPAPEYLTGNLERGEYFWRVSRIEQGREGLFSATGRLVLKQTLEPPVLAVQFPADRSPAGPYTLTGRVEPGSKIFIDGSEVAVQASGAFSCQGVLKPGVNLIRIEALDPAGNASYASRIVYGSD